MYRYETHMHTAPISRCGHATIGECLEFYKSLDYDGVFITNHFIDGNLNIEKTRPYEEKIEFYFSDHEEGIEIGRKLGIKVFPGVELSLGGTDFLVYGLDKEWFLSHPEIADMKKKAELAFMMEHGALIIQAHPFREASYIDHIRLFPRSVHGVEIINACRTEEENALADIYANHYNLLKFAGSDNHNASRQKKLAGVGFEEPINSVDEFITKIKNNEFDCFTLENE